MNFLDGPAAEVAIRRLLSEAKFLRAAVAYWGDGAVGRLGIEGLTTRDVQIVCDVLSGGCNPKEVQRIQAAVGSDNVKRCDRLHAKVWITDRGPVIGSSNASCNGLGSEADEMSGSIEANLFVDEPSTVSEIKAWFDVTITPRSQIITAGDLKIAQRRWSPRQPTRPLPEASSVLGLLKSNPASFRGRNFYVSIYKHERRGAAAEHELKEQKEVRHNSKIDCWEQDKALPPGAYVLDFDLGSNGRAKLCGLFRVVTDDHFIKTKGGGHILLCMRAKNFGNLALGDTAIWESVASKAAKNKREWESTIENIAPFLEERP
jgi:hypothetical protein